MWRRLWRRRRRSRRNSRNHARAEGDHGRSHEAGHVSCPGAEAPTTNGPAAEALLEGAEYDAETEDAAESSEAAAAARVRPPKPSNWGAMSGTQRKNWEHITGRFTFGPHGTQAAAGAAEDWQMGNAGAEAMDLDGLSTAEGAVAPPGATTHDSAAEALLEGAEYDAEMEDAVRALEVATVATAAARMRSPRPADWFK